MLIVYSAEGGRCFRSKVTGAEASRAIQGIIGRYRPQAVLRRHDLAAGKWPSGLARGGRPIVTAAEIPNG